MSAVTPKTLAAAHAWVDGARTAKALGEALGVTPGAAWGRLARAQAAGLVPHTSRQPAPAAAPVERGEPGRLDVVSLSRLPRLFPLLDRETLVTYHGHIVGTFQPADTPPPLTPDDVVALGVEPYHPNADPAVELLKLAAEVAALAVDLGDLKGARPDNRRLRAYQSRRLAYVIAAKGDIEKGEPG